MLAEHCIDVERAANIAGWINGANLNRSLIRRCIKLAHIFRRDGKHAASRRRIARHTAAEVVDFPGQAFFIAFAQEVDVRSDHRLIVCRC